MLDLFCWKIYMKGKKEHCNITLRAFRLEDVSDVMAWVIDERVGKWCWWDVLRSRDDVRSYLEVSLSSCWSRAVCLDGRPIGQVTFKHGTGIDSCRGEVGYAIAHDYWGKGIATRALKLAVSTIFDELPEIKRIEAFTTDTNFGSQRVLEKAGFAKEALLRNYRLKNGEVLNKFIFSILADS